ncbi:UPF0496 protein [Musa troglodytarum]|uniref:Protein Abitram n=1 Tax=Musa troglodytarum TaxID=320322 RepID=A0A9E7JLN1_9LILI|nr:UPF0496 protein [Musa troglodytarum]
MQRISRQFLHRLWSPTSFATMPQVLVKPWENFINDRRISKNSLIHEIYYSDFLKPGHDQYVYRHANGLCVVGLAPSHAALREEGGVTAVNFNVGKSDRSEMKVTGKRKRNAQHFDAKTSLCKVCANGKEFIVRCCVKGSLLEVNDRLLKQPDLLNSSADREGYIAIIMPKPIDWAKIKDSLLSHEDYKKLRGLS